MEYPHFLPNSLRCQTAALCLLLLLEPSCKPSAKNLHHITVDNSAFVENEISDGLNIEARELVAHYLQTGEVNAASPQHQLTMLHLAAVTHRYWLVEQLLAEGANPNARDRRLPEEGAEPLPGETPAILAMRVAGGYRSNNDALLIIKALIAKGANINERAINGQNILTLCEGSYYRHKSGYMDGESFALELMALGARGDKDAAFHFIREDWNRALKTLLLSPEGADIRKNMPELLQKCTEEYACYDGSLNCLKLLLSYATPEEVRGTPGCNPLYNIARYVQGKIYAEQRRENGIEAIALLMSKGGDPQMPGGSFGASSAADHIVACTWLHEGMQKRGLTITPPAHHFHAEKLVEQMLDIPTEAIRTEEVVAQFEQIASIFRMPRGVTTKADIWEAESQHEDYKADTLLPNMALGHYRRACARALSHLHKADKERTCAMLMELPAWHEPSAWEGEALEASRGMLAAILENEGVVLPSAFLVQAARRMEAAGKPAAAHSFIRLLKRNADAADPIEELCSEGTPLPLRAAAWCCRLELMGKGAKALPAPGNIREWLRSEHLLYHVDNEDYPIISIARRAEESADIPGYSPAAIPPELLFYERLEVDRKLRGITKVENRRAQDALLKLGAPLAASFFGAPAPAELSAELASLKERYGLATAASFELELALALYMWENKEVFLDPRAHRRETARSRR